MTTAVADPDRRPPKPDQPCVCGCGCWWWREPNKLCPYGQWVCCQCHPKPVEKEKNDSLDSEV